MFVQNVGDYIDWIFVRKGKKQRTWTEVVQIIGKSIISYGKACNHWIEYNDKNQEDYISLYSLVGTLVREEMEELSIARRALYPFTIFFGPNSVRFYALKKEEQLKWTDALKEAIGYSHLSEFYTVKVCASFFTK